MGRLVSSPLGRARDTAEALGLAMPVEVDERWVEVDYGELEGRALGAVPAELWARWRADPAFAPPGASPWPRWASGSASACDELFARPARGARGDDDVVVVSHVSPIKAAVAWALGAGDEVVWRLYLATASITRIGWGGDGPVLHRYNETVASRRACGESRPSGLRPVLRRRAWSRARGAGCRRGR